MENFQKHRNGFLTRQSTQKVNATFWRFKPSPKEQSQGKNKINAQIFFTGANALRNFYLSQQK